MSTYRRRGIDPGVPRTGPDPLATLLAAAAAPARRDELAGEQAALTAFREARLSPVGRPRRGSMIKPVLARLLTAKIVLAAATTTALAGGVVMAAQTGNLPALPGRSAHTSGPTPSHGPSHRPTPAGAEGTRGGASPSPPSMVGLCHAYTAGVANRHGKAPDNPAFSALISRAGGRDGVAGYCATVLATAPGSHPTGHAGEHGMPTPHPTGRANQPSTHPTGQAGEHSKPKSHPTRHPTPHPTGGPAHPNS